MDILNDQDWHIVYPLLLQKIIEGVNKGEHVEIMQIKLSVSVIIHPCKSISHFEVVPNDENLC